MNIVTSIRGRWLAVGMAAVAALAAALVLLLAHSAPAPADVNLNNLDCRGHVQKGSPAKDETGSPQVKYVFACNGPITGFQIQPNVEVQGYETEVFGIDAKTQAVVPTDSFSCNGDLPGYGINCVGNAGFLDNKLQTYDPSQKSYVQIPGQFSITGDICAEPRVDPLLTVVTAVKNSDGTVAQKIAGPFDLGRPSKSGCKASASSGKIRIPSTGPDTSGDLG